MRTIIKYLSSLTVLLLIGIVFMNGTGRHDVKLKKYFEFAKDSVFDCIGEVYDKNKNEFIESCVLIDQNHVLLAAHGLYMDSDSMIMDSVTVLKKKYPIQRPAFSYLADNASFYFKFNDRKFDVKRIVIHPGYDNSFSSLGFNDIAIVELAEPVISIKPAVLYTDSNEMHTRAIACGYGAISKAKGSNARLAKRKKMAGENMIDSMGGNKINGQWGAMYADMDHPGTMACNRIGSAVPLPLEWRSDQGDCGSGLFIWKDNTWQLAGINFGPSYFDDWKTYGEKYGYYGFIDGWTRVSPLLTWIERETKKDGG